jgi:hypothetical protein
MKSDKTRTQKPATRPGAGAAESGVATDPG